MSPSCLSAESNQTRVAEVWCSFSGGCCRLPRRRVRSTSPALWSGLLASHEWMSGLAGVLLEGDVSPWQPASSSKLSGQWLLQPYLSSPFRPGPNLSFNFFLPPVLALFFWCAWCVHVVLHCCTFCHGVTFPFTQIQHIFTKVLICLVWLHFNTLTQISYLAFFISQLFQQWCQQPHQSFLRGSGSKLEIRHESFSSSALSQQLCVVLKDLYRKKKVRLVTLRLRHSHNGADSAFVYLRGIRIFFLGTSQ